MDEREKRNLERVPAIKWYLNLVLNREWRRIRAARVSKRIADCVVNKWSRINNIIMWRALNYECMIICISRADWMTYLIIVEWQRNTMPMLCTISVVTICRQYILEMLRNVTMWRYGMCRPIIIVVHVVTRNSMHKSWFSACREELLLCTNWGTQKPSLCGLNVCFADHQH